MSKISSRRYLHGHLFIELKHYHASNVSNVITKIHTLTHQKTTKIYLYLYSSTFPLCSNVHYTQVIFCWFGLLIRIFFLLRCCLAACSTLGSMYIEEHFFVSSCSCNRQRRESLPDSGGATHTKRCRSKKMSQIS